MKIIKSIPQTNSIFSEEKLTYSVKLRDFKLVRIIVLLLYILVTLIALKNKEDTFDIIILDLVGIVTLIVASDTFFVLIKQESEWETSRFVGWIIYLNFKTTKIKNFSVKYFVTGISKTSKIKIEFYDNQDFIGSIKTVNREAKELQEILSMYNIPIEIKKRTKPSYKSNYK